MLETSEHELLPFLCRSNSGIWSNHDSNLLRGMDTNEFKAMKEAMGPVKIM